MPDISNYTRTVLPPATREQALYLDPYLDWDENARTAPSVFAERYSNGGGYNAQLESRYHGGMMDNHTQPE